MNKRPNEKNERIKRRFLEYRKHAKQLSEASLDREIAALERFDVWNGRTGFARFHVQQAMGFRAHLETAKGATGKPLGKSTMKAVAALVLLAVLPSSVVAALTLPLAGGWAGLTLFTLARASQGLSPL